MKRNLFLLLFVLLSIQLNAQVLKLRSSAVAFRYFDEYLQTWGEYSDWEEANVLITITDDRVRIFSKEEQTYDVIEDLGKETDYKGSIISSWICVNEDGKKCKMRFVKHEEHSQNTMQLYIHFSDMAWVYEASLVE